MNMIQGAFETDTVTADRTQTWVIKKFSMLPSQASDCTTSPEFKVGSRSFHIDLYPGGVDDDSKDQVSLYLTLSDWKSKGAALANYVFTLVSQIPDAPDWTVENEPHC